MDVIEAEDLWDWASMEVNPNQMFIYRIANGEHVLRLRKYDYWCWCREDFLKYRQTMEDQHSKHKQLAEVS